MDTIQKALSPLLEMAHTRQVQKGQIIIYEGDRPDEVYVLSKGAVKLHDIDDQGNEKILHILRDWAIMPFAFFSGNEDPTHWFYTALTDCEVYVLRRDELHEYILARGEVSMVLMNWFSQEVHELLVRLSSLGKTVTRDKLLVVLRYLAVRQCDSHNKTWRQINFPVNQQLLADMIGVTRESVAITIKELQNEGYVRHPKVTVLEVNLPKVIDAT